MALFKSENTQGSSAKVVDDTLIISLPDAKSPIVWRMDLGHIKSTALEVSETQDGASYVLGMRSDKKETQEIAPFDSKEKAVNALMAITKAMENAPANRDTASAQVMPATAIPVQKKGGGKLAAVIGIGVLCVLIYAMISLTPQNVELGATDNAGAPNTSGLPNDRTIGQPMSADEFLMNR